MERVEALKLAEDLTGRLVVGPTNARGYKDVSAQPTLTERADTVLRVADWLLAGNPGEENPYPMPDSGSVPPPTATPPPPPIGFTI